MVGFGIMCRIVMVQVSETCASRCQSAQRHDALSERIVFPGIVTGIVMQAA